jgi:hypothetical protein
VVTALDLTRERWTTLEWLDWTPYSRTLPAGPVERWRMLRDGLIEGLYRGRITGFLWGPWRLTDAGREALRQHRQEQPS